jgi:very-short-patch-repair endonuclease
MDARRAKREVGHRIGAEVHSSALDAALAALAARQYGVAARWQLLEIGFTRRMIARRIQAGRLHVIHRGVYAVGHTRIPQEGRWLAAVLACGEGAVLSHRSAAALWGIRPYSGKPEVIAPHAHRRGSLLVARRSSIAPSDRTEHRGIPSTTPEPTLIDYATVAKPHQIDRAVREAEFLRIVDFAVLGQMLERRPRGTKALRVAVARAAESMARTRSDLEDRFRTLVVDEEMPTPLFNQTIELGEMPIEADAVWPDARVIVELDSWGAHGTHSQFIADRARDRAAQAAGWLVLRYTWQDIDRQAARQLRKLLSERTPPRSGRPRSADLRA